jgi:hypothetical protein
MPTLTWNNDDIRGIEYFSMNHPVPGFFNNIISSLHLKTEVTGNLEQQQAPVGMQGSPREKGVKPKTSILKT